MAIDPADRKFYPFLNRMARQTPPRSPQYGLAPAKPRTPTTLNRGQQADAARYQGLYRQDVFNRVPANVRYDIDPNTGLPWDWVVNLVGIAESGGNWQKRNGNARGAFQFGDDSELAVAQYLGLPTHHPDGRQIRADERDPVTQEAMFRTLWGSSEFIPGIEPGRSHWEDSQYQTREGERYPHMWGNRMDRIVKAPLEDRAAIYREIMKEDTHPEFYPVEPQETDTVMRNNWQTMPASSPSTFPIASPDLPGLGFIGTPLPRRIREGRGLPLPTGTPFVPFDGSVSGQQALGGIREGAAYTTPFLNQMLFGPERPSALFGDATRFERFVRDWGLSEQEFRTAAERAQEGRYGAATGWGLLGLAGAVPFLGDIAQGLGRAPRAARVAEDVAGVVDALPANRGPIYRANYTSEVPTGGMDEIKKDRILNPQILQDPTSPTAARLAQTDFSNFSYDFIAPTEQAQIAENIRDRWIASSGPVRLEPRTQTPEGWAEFRGVPVRTFNLDETIQVGPRVVARFNAPQQDAIRFLTEGIQKFPIEAWHIADASGLRLASRILPFYDLLRAIPQYRPFRLPVEGGNLRVSSANGSMISDLREPVGLVFDNTLMMIDGRILSSIPEFPMEHIAARMSQAARRIIPRYTETEILSPRVINMSWDNFKETPLAHAGNSELTFFPLRSGTRIGLNNGTVRSGAYNSTEEIARNLSKAWESVVNNLMSDFGLDRFEAMQAARATMAERLSTDLILDHTIGHELSHIVQRNVRFTDWIVREQGAPVFEQSRGSFPSDIQDPLAYERAMREDALAALARETSAGRPTDNATFSLGRSSGDKTIPTTLRTLPAQYDQSMGKMGDWASSEFDAITNYSAFRQAVERNNPWAWEQPKGVVAVWRGTEPPPPVQGPARMLPSRMAEGQHEDTAEVFGFLNAIQDNPKALRSFHELAANRIRELSEAFVRYGYDVPPILQRRPR